MMENKIEFIKNLQNLINMTSAFDTLVIEVGYRDWNGEFVQSDERLEWICLHWNDQDKRFGRYQSIEADSCYGILIDTMKVLCKLA